MTTHYDAPHKAHDEDKLTALVEAFRTGATITPVLVYGYRAMTGSHRIAAWERAMDLWESGAAGWQDMDDAPALPIVEMDDALWAAACALRDIDDLDQLCDCNDICDALYDATDDAEIKAALEDQRGW